MILHVPGTDLAQRFSDQFRPLQITQLVSWARENMTIFRFPLRSAEQAADGKLKTSVECTDASVACILDNFKTRASSALLFLKTVEEVKISSLMCFRELEELTSHIISTALLSWSPRSREHENQYSVNILLPLYKYLALDWHPGLCHSLGGRRSCTT